MYLHYASRVKLHVIEQNVFCLNSLQSDCTAQTIEECYIRGHSLQEQERGHNYIQIFNFQCQFIRLSQGDICIQHTRRLQQLRVLTSLPFSGYQSPFPQGYEMKLIIDHLLLHARSNVSASPIYVHVIHTEITCNEYIDQYNPHSYLRM